MKFFRIMLPGFETQLKLPHYFCKKAKYDFSWEAEVTTGLGEWEIKCGKEGEAFYFYGKEWTKFVNRHELEVGSFLLFEHHGSFSFHASIFDTTVCEKLKFQSADSESSSDDETEPLQRGANPTLGRRFANPTFRRTLKYCSGYKIQKIENSRLYIPMKIWRPNNLQHKTEAILRISGLETKEWKAKLAFYPGRAHGDDRLLVRGGWYEFVSANKIEQGHNYAFEIVVDASEYGYSDKSIIIIVTKQL